MLLQDSEYCTLVTEQRCPIDICSKYFVSSKNRHFYIAVPALRDLVESQQKPGTWSSGRHPVEYTEAGPPDIFVYAGAAPCKSVVYAGAGQTKSAV